MPFQRNKYLNGAASDIADLLRSARQEYQDFASRSSSIIPEEVSQRVLEEFARMITGLEDFDPKKDKSFGVTPFGIWHWSMTLCSLAQQEIDHLLLWLRYKKQRIVLKNMP